MEDVGSDTDEKQHCTFIHFFPAHFYRKRSMPSSGEVAMKKTDKLLFFEISLSHKRARQ